jgi:hypothetical protein
MSIGPIRIEAKGVRVWPNFPDRDAWRMSRCVYVSWVWRGVGRMLFAWPAGGLPEFPMAHPTFRCENLAGGATPLTVYYRIDRACVRVLRRLFGIGP